MRSSSHLSQHSVKADYLLNEISHFHLRTLLRHVGLHLRIGVVDDGEEHVLSGKKVKRDEGHAAGEHSWWLTKILLFLP